MRPGGDHARRADHPSTTLIILGSSAIGDSWFPLLMMPKAVQQVARITLVAWAMEGYNWRQQPYLPARL